MKNTGREYEELTEEIFKSILDMKNYVTLRLDRNVKVKGKSGQKHEIDVYWEYQLGHDPSPKLILFQSKDWKSNVSKGDVMAFHCVLQDIPGQPNGIYVTKTGYQSGAIEYAKFHGNPLWELRPPTKEDWENRIKDIHFEIHCSTPDVKLEFSFDNEWARNKFDELGIEPVELSMAGMKRDIYIFDKQFQQTNETLDSIENKYIKICEDSKSDHMEIEHDFVPESYIRTNNDAFPFMKINGIKFDINILKHNETMIIKGEDVVKYKLSECFSGALFTINKDNRLIPHSNT